MRTLIRQLRAWRRREWLYRAAWGFARWASLVIGVLAAACLGDWLLDRWVDVPFALRVAVTTTQLLIAGVAAYFLLIHLRTPSLVALAGRAEAAVPEFDHRLVTALQLNRRGAQTAGMSAALIRQVTDEAESLSARHRLTALADPRRLKWAAGLLLPVLLAAGGFAAARPQLVGALLARQCLLPVDVPRSVAVKNVTPELWPTGDEVELRFEVTGEVRDGDRAYALVVPVDQPEEVFPLTLREQVGPGKTIYTARLPPSSTPFVFRAWVADGRTRETGYVRFAPRPVVQEVNAWVLLPAYVDPEGKRRYERFQPQGEVLALPDSAVRVQAVSTKPVSTAVLVLYARTDAGAETVADRKEMKLSPDGQTAEVVFDLPPRPTGYRIELTDENGFGNAYPPRRGITLAPDEPPRVNLLAEVLKDPSEEGPLDDYEVNGMPLALGGQVQVGYAAKSPLGVAGARIMYRVNDGPWTPLPLKQVDADPAQVGKFIPELGLFERSGLGGQVEFYPLPSADPATEPPGLEAGGRYNFQTAALTKITEAGETAKLAVGDRVEFFVEAFDRKTDTDRRRGVDRPGGRSESRIKTVVTQAQLQAWLDQRDQSRERLRQIEERQRGVFAQPKP